VLRKLVLRVATAPLRVAAKALGLTDGPPPAPPIRFDPPPIDRRPPPPIPVEDDHEQDVELEPEVVLDRLRAGEELVLVDVREPDEVARTGHATNARLIPLGQLDRRAGELPKDKKIVLYCAAGMRSFDGARHLREHGFPDAWSVVGGLPAWLRAGGGVTSV
jgi:rhodanese-related sulfurtransferase